MGDEHLRNQKLKQILSQNISLYRNSLPKTPQMGLNDLLQQVLDEMDEFRKNNVYTEKQKMIQDQIFV